MKGIKFYQYGHTDALDHATHRLSKLGYTFLPYPADEVTHLLLPVPSFDSSGNVNNGGPLAQVLELLPPDITVVGGKLDHALLKKYKTIDLLRDPDYLAENAAITAQCAIKTALNHSRSVLTDNNILIIGWGRIGKCLSMLLKSIGCRVTVAARRPEDRAILSAMGYDAEDSNSIVCSKYTIIFNTSPEPVLSVSSKDILAIELASTPGLMGSGIIIARGLPANEAPISSGKLIAKTIHKIIGNRT